MADDAGITMMGEKGQVVIPKTLRDELRLPPKTRFLVYGEGDVIVLQRLVLPDMQKEWSRIFSAADRKRLGLTEAEVGTEVAARRREQASGRPGRRSPGSSRTRTSS